MMLAYIVRYVSDLEAAKTKDIVQGLPRVEEFLKLESQKILQYLVNIMAVVEFHR